ncbi:MAG: hypothetical protein P8N49_01535 [Opitutales bacterium]|nr:hypothetical protein [Opitutales bacterium]
MTLSNSEKINTSYTIKGVASFRSSDQKLKILILADEQYSAEVVKDHVQAISAFSRHDVIVKSPRKRRKYLPSPKVSLQDENGLFFDVIIIHYSLCILFESYIPKYLRKGIREFSGIKVQIIQDEYRWINKMMNEMSFLGIDAIFSSLNLENLNRVYRKPELNSVLKVSCLPGYVPERLIGVDSPRISEREIHLGYRGRELPYWLGRLSYEKTRLSDEVGKRIKNLPLNIDLSSKEKDRLYRDDWKAFLKSTKAVLGLEGGASIFDFDGEVERAVSNYLELNPRADFEEVSTQVLSPYEGNIVHQTITPRSFEAIAYKTVQVLLKGEYRGVLQPWKHYLPLERDFSNIDKIVSYLNDDIKLQEIADLAYREIIGSGLYSSSILGQGVDGVVDLIRNFKTKQLCAE